MRIITNIKRYAWAIGAFIIMALGILLGFKNRDIEKLKDRVQNKEDEIATQKEAIANEAKKGAFEVDDITENLEVVKDFEAIDEQLESEVKNETTNNNSDTFSFNA